MGLGVVRRQSWWLRWAKLMTGNQRDWGAQGCGREGAQLASRGQEHEKELIDYGKIWEQLWQWLCQGVVSHGPALLSHLGHRVLQKPDKKRYPHTRWTALRECHVKDWQNCWTVKMSSEATPSLTERTGKITVRNRQFKKNCKSDINPEICGETRSTCYFSTELSTS